VVVNNAGSLSFDLPIVPTGKKGESNWVGEQHLAFKIGRYLLSSAVPLAPTRRFMEHAQADLFADPDQPERNAVLGRPVKWYRGHDPTCPLLVDSAGGFAQIADIGRRCGEGSEATRSEASTCAFDKRKDRLTAVSRNVAA
jgi:hypothetical protein